MSERTTTQAIKYSKEEPLLLLQLSLQPCSVLVLATSSIVLYADDTFIFFFFCQSLNLSPDLILKLVSSYKSHLWALGAHGDTEILCHSYLQMICQHLKQLLPRPSYHRPGGKLSVLALSLRPLSHVTRPRTNQSLFGSGSSAPSPVPADFLLRLSTLEH